MVQIDDTIISLDVFEKKFVCDLLKCKGECCIEGDAGAPLEDDEIEKLKEVLPLIWEDLPQTSKEVIDAQGVSYKDRDGDNVTSIVNGAECVFMYKDENGFAKCAIEKAFLAGKTTFRKPISCYLYPIRIDKYTKYQAVNYHKWKICECAVKNGEKLNVPVYKFLKDPLIQKFGEAWYEQLEIAAEELKDYFKTKK